VSRWRIIRLTITNLAVKCSFPVIRLRWLGFFLFFIFFEKLVYFCRLYETISSEARHYPRSERIFVRSFYTWHECIALKRNQKLRGVTVTVPNRSFNDRLSAFIFERQQLEVFSLCGIKQRRIYPDKLRSNTWIWSVKCQSFHDLCILIISLCKSSLWEVWIHLRHEHSSADLPGVQNFHMFFPTMFRPNAQNVLSDDKRIHGFW